MHLVAILYWFIWPGRVTWSSNRTTAMLPLLYCCVNVLWVFSLLFTASLSAGASGRAAPLQLRVVRRATASASLLLCAVRYLHIRVQCHSATGTRTCASRTCHVCNDFTRVCVTLDIAGCSLIKSTVRHSAASFIAHCWNPMCSSCTQFCFPRRNTLRIYTCTSI